MPKQIRRRHQEPESNKENDSPRQIDNKRRRVGLAINLDSENRTNQVASSSSSTSAKTWNVVEDLPHELTHLIFSFVPLRDLYRNCSFVSKSWHFFVSSSHLLFDQALSTEFRGNILPFRAAKFVEKLRQETQASQGFFSKIGLKTSSIGRTRNCHLQRYCCKFDRRDYANIPDQQAYQTHLQLPVWRFVRLLDSRFAMRQQERMPVWLSLPLSSHEITVSRNITRFYTLINLQSIFFQHPFLFIPIAVQIDETVQQTEYRCVRVGFIDHRFNLILCEVKHVKNGWVVINNFWPGTYFVVIQGRPLAIRLVTPHTADRFL